MIPIPWVSAWTAFADDTTTCSTPPGSEVKLAWTPSLQDGVLELTLAIDPTLSVAVEAQAALGGRTHVWDQGTYASDAQGTWSSASRFQRRRSSTLPRSTT
ncbi:MAG: hypothetical protein ABMA64_34380 [Myxococcota bacterium]